VAILDTIKVRGEEISARVSGYLNRDHLAAVAGSTVVVFLEEVINAAIRAAMRLPPSQDLAAKDLMRIIFGGIAYYGLRNRAPLVGLVSSSTLAVMVLSDLVNLLFRATPEAIGATIASSIHARFAAAAAVLPGAAQQTAVARLGTIVSVQAPQQSIVQAPAAPAAAPATAMV